MAEQLADDLHHAADSWPWPEPVVTYENGIVPRALIEAGVELGRPRWTAHGLELLTWLLAAQTTPEGHLRPVGNRGWWPRGDEPAIFDQQPIEAHALLEAARAAWMATADPRWTDEMTRAYGWFLGANVAGIPVADPSTGACHDGLGPRGVSANCGAESTLVWLLSVERMRAMGLESIEEAGITGHPAAAASY